MKIRISNLSLAIALAMMLAGPAWGQSAKSVGELAKYSRADREKILYDDAKKEGKVVWYTSLVLPSAAIDEVFELVDGLESVAEITTLVHALSASARKPSAAR